MLAGAALARAQTLPPQVLALYPPQAGELVFVDLQAARRSPHYPELKKQVLPERFRDWEAWARRLGVDFDSNVYRLSWAFIGAGDAEGSDLVGVAEGNFDPEGVDTAARQSELRVSEHAGAHIYWRGTNEAGREFVFAVLEGSKLLFGQRAPVLAMVERAVQGGPSILDQPEMRGLIEEVNRRTAVWMVLNGEFTHLGVRQVLGEAAKFPGVETLTQRVRNATVRMGVDRGLDTRVTARCASAADALWFAAFLEGALFIQHQRLSESNPQLARILSDARVERLGDRVELRLAVSESDMIALLQGGGLSFSF